MEESKNLATELLHLWVEIHWIRHVPRKTPTYN